MKKYIAVLTIAIVAGALGFGVAAAGGGDNTTPSTSAHVKVGRAPATASAQVQSAVVRSDGTLARSFPKSGVSSELISGDVGGYEVAFPRNVRKCTYSATLGLPGSSGSADAGFVTVVGRAGNANAVYVRTMDINGSDLDQSFHLIISCKPA